MSRFANLTRRQMLGGAGAFFAAANLPRFASADPRDPRLIVIILRGAMDGLSAVAPLGDPDYADLHGALALQRDGDHAALPLDGFFGLNPAMKTFARLYAEKKALIVHATSTNYRDRSHFDGQDVLESGMPTPGRVESGWLNRAVAQLPVAQRAEGGALAVGYLPPLVLRGPAPILGWAPADLPSPSEDLIARLGGLYDHTDPALALALREGLMTERVVRREQMGAMKSGGGLVEQMRKATRGAARLMAADDGPRIAALAFDGWDTHVQEGGATGTLAQLLGGLDETIGEFERALGSAWNQTVLVAITEFGRTAHINGNLGCDHGTGSAAFLAGGAVAGGRVLADWPGLKPKQLYENRDLAATTDLRGVLKGVLGDHLGLSSTLLAESIFPETREVVPAQGIIAS